MASEDVLETWIDQFEQRVCSADDAEALASEVRELRKDKARLDWILSMRLSESRLLCAEAEVAIAGGREEIDAAMGAAGNG